MMRWINLCSFRFTTRGIYPPENVMKNWKLQRLILRVSVRRSIECTLQTTHMYHVTLSTQKCTIISLLHQQFLLTLHWLLLQKCEKFEVQKMENSQDHLLHMLKKMSQYFTGLENSWSWKSLRLIPIKEFHFYSLGTFSFTLEMLKRI